MDGEGVGASATVVSCNKDVNGPDLFCSSEQTKPKDSVNHAYGFDGQWVLLCGPYSLTPKLLKLSAECVSGSLCNLFNQSLQCGTLSRVWATANVIPVYKKGECYLVNNY